MIYGHTVKYNGVLYEPGQNVPINIEETPIAQDENKGDFDVVEVKPNNTTPKVTKPKSVAKTQSNVKNAKR